MATTTTKLALTKPDGTDLVDIAVLNANADKIDAASGATICTSSTRPASPWNGQVIFETDTLNALVYRTSTTSWNILGGSTVASEPPAGAGNGNFWWDSDNGKLYIYYNDGNSGQWVSVMPATTAVDVSQNYVINGGMDIWQRGTSITATNNNYTADQWIATPYGSGGSFTVAKGTTNAPSGFQNYMKVTPISSSSVNLFIAKFFETQDVIQLAGKTVTLSFQYKIPVSFTSQWSSSVWYSTATDSKVWAPTSATQIGSYNVLTNVTSWTSSSVTFTIPSNATSLGIQFASTNNVVGTAEFNLTGVQLERGTVATSFKRAAGTLQGELAACQRYYAQIGPFSGVASYVGFGTLQAANTTVLAGLIALPVPMRVPPGTLSWTGTIGHYNIYTGGGGITGTLSLAGDRTSNVAAWINATGSGFTASSFYYLNAVNNNAAYLGFSAEL